MAFLLDIFGFLTVMLSGFIRSAQCFYIGSIAFLFLATSSFQALIYMHRYRPDTVSIVLNDYLRAYRNKLEAHRKALEAQTVSFDATPAQRTRAEKEVGEVSKVIAELDAYERDVLFPLATQKVEIDLDDGVKANYPKFGAALKPIKGLSDADD